MFVLASASPRRQELLARVGYSFRQDASDEDESVLPGEAPADYVLRIARKKAATGSHKHPGVWILAADTTVALGKKILGKPDDAYEAESMLVSLSGQEHAVITSFVLANGVRLIDHIEHSTVRFRTLSAREIAMYVQCKEWRGKAGGYAMQGIAAGFIEEIRGCPTNIIGLPLSPVMQALAEIGITPDFAQGRPA